MAIFGVRSLIKIQNTPRTGLGQSLTLNGYISGFTYFTWRRRFKTVLRSSPPWSANPWYCSTFRCLLLRCNVNCKISNANVDRNWKWSFMSFFDCFKKIVTEMTTDHWFKICETNNYKGNIRNIQINYTMIIIVQYTIAENVPFIVQFHENCNKINIDHSPTRYWL